MDAHGDTMKTVGTLNDDLEVKKIKQHKFDLLLRRTCALHVKEQSIRNMR